VKVLLGNGNGTFHGAVTFDEGSLPQSVAVADVNGDGRPDLVTGIYSGSVSVLLGNRNAATHFKVKAPASVTAGTSFTITVTAETAGNQLDAVYTGTIHFKSSDASAVLPPNYTFTLADAGSHTFTVTLNTTGSQTITATDTHTSSITGKATVTVGAVPPPGRSSGGGDSAEAAVAAAASQFLSSSTGTGMPPALFTFGNAIGTPPSFPATWNTAGNRAIAAPDTAPYSTGTAPLAVRPAGWSARVGQPLDPAVDVLSPAGIAAFFAQDESKQWG
jgi:hypothetical protein